MDSAGVGALIGVGIMVGGCLFCYLKDIYKKQKEKHYQLKKNSIKKAPSIVVVQNPLSVKAPVSEKTPILVRISSHKKLKEILPLP